MKRRVDTGSLLRALSITVISLMIICFGAFLISLVDGITFEDVLFETFSAFGTVGVTTGVTTQFSYFGKLLLMAMMFFGRVGILTITYETVSYTHLDVYKRQVLSAPYTGGGALLHRQRRSHAAAPQPACGRG